MDNRTIGGGGLEMDNRTIGGGGLEMVSINIIILQGPDTKNYLYGFLSSLRSNSTRRVHHKKLHLYIYTVCVLSDLT